MYMTFQYVWLPLTTLSHSLLVDGSSLRAYVSDDVHGIEIAGAVKNVLKIHAIN